MQNPEKEIEEHIQPKTLTLHLPHGEKLKTTHKHTTKNKEEHVRNQLNVIEESIESNHFWENWKTLYTNTTTRVINPKLTYVNKPLLQTFWLYNKEQTAKTYTFEAGSLHTLRLESLKFVFQPLHKFLLNKL